MNFQLDLNVTWFVLVGILLTGYAILDGFDLGVGVLHLFTRREEERRLMLNTIGPVWDGNEVWLVTGGGALFAAFPRAYAAAFSGFYIEIILLLFALIFRAVAIEFRSSRPARWWRQLWDIGFSLSSIGSCVLFGILVGNVIKGLPLNAEHEFTGRFTDLAHPYPVLIGISTLALFAMHGSTYVALKTEGEFRDKVLRWARRSVVCFAVCYFTTTAATLWYVPHMTERMTASPGWFAVPVFTALMFVHLAYQISRGREWPSFLSSCGVIVGLMALLGVGMFPCLIYASPNPELSLTLHNAASSPKTLRIMLVFALIGMPLALAYTASVYKVFSGKVRLDSSSY
jgi:cytochrome bd ubiquinol oxidase subunit II